MSRTSRAFSLKIARISFSSAVSSVSPFGVTLPTSRSPEPTSAPMRTTPRSSRSSSDSSERFGMSRVISSSPSFGRARVDLVLVDVDRGEHVLLDEPLRDHDRVLEVVALPRHEGDEQVRAERELALVGRAAVRQHLLGPAPCRPRPTIGFWWISVPWFERMNFVSGYSCLPSFVVDDDPVGVDVDDACPRSSARIDVAGVDRGAVLEAGADERRLRDHQRHGLPLHVRAHQRAVRVVVLEERDQRRSRPRRSAPARRP